MSRLQINIKRNLDKLILQKSLKIMNINENRRKRIENETKMNISFCKQFLIPCSE